eukprot:1491377-Rhodomonas_salina.1
MEEVCCDYQLECTGQGNQPTARVGIIGVSDGIRLSLRLVDASDHIRAKACENAPERVLDRCSRVNASAIHTKGDLVERVGETW